ncbi:MAG: YeeE/YedE family protein, partial [Gammaproteobacteria bacterium]|nr:YeeE/YedE family protein [Gammaproteobacteria bacterium]
AQFMAIALFALMAFPLLALAPDELSPAHAPVGIAMIVAAFVFGIAMQVVMGCGSGVLVNAGSGNLVALLALPGFMLGSFAGSLHVSWWTSLGSLPVLSLQGLFGNGPGLWLTLAALFLMATAAVWRAQPGKRLPVARLWWAAVLIAALAVVNLLISGQSWGVVYGLGLWGAKLANAGGMDVAASAFWATNTNAERLQQNLLTDVTSLTNIGIIAGAFVVMQWRRALNQGKADEQVTLPRPSLWLVMLLAGIVLGYSSRLAFGCNVGAYFSGIATGSVHGWVWFFAAFAGAAVGIRLRKRLFAPAVASSKPDRIMPIATIAGATMPGRPLISMAALALVLLLLLIDQLTAEPVNPFAAPPPAAYGSGLAPQGAHCTNL